MFKGRQKKQRPKPRVFDQTQKSVCPGSQNHLCKRTWEIRSELVHFIDFQKGQDRL